MADAYAFESSYDLAVKLQRFKRDGNAALAGLVEAELEHRANLRKNAATPQTVITVPITSGQYSQAVPISRDDEGAQK